MTNRSENFVEPAESFLLNVWEQEKKISSLNGNFDRTVVLDTWNSTSQLCLEHFCQIASNSFADSPRRLKKHFFSKKNSSKLPMDRTGGKHFWHSGANYLWEIRKQFGTSPDVFTRILKKTICSPKNFFRRKEKLLKTLLMIYNEKLNFHCQTKKLLKTNFPIEDIPRIVPLDTKTAVLRKLSKTSAKEPNFFLTLFQKRSRLTEENFLQTFLWRHRKHFSQRFLKIILKCQKFFNERLEFLQ